jgi:putative flippase GtrA
MWGSRRPTGSIRSRRPPAGGAGSRIGPRLRAALRAQLAATLGKFAVGSLVATLVSQLTFILCYGVAQLPAFGAGVIGFVAGSVPAYLINRYWTWRHGLDGNVAAGHRLLPYYVVMISCALASSGLTALADHFIGPLVAGDVARTAVIDVCYLASFGLMFVVKFVALDRIVFARNRTRVGQGDRPGRERGEEDTAAARSMSSPSRN